MIYALVLARSDGTLGPDMQRIERPCTREQMVAALIGMPAADAQCGRQEDWQSIIETIQYGADRPVIDKTGLSGYFSVAWSFNTEPAAGSATGPAVCPQSMDRRRTLRAPNRSGPAGRK